MIIIPEYYNTLLYFEVLHLGSGQSQASIQLGEEWIESSPEDEYLEVLDGKRLSLAHECALAAQKTNHMMSCTKSSVRSRWREGIDFASPLCLCETPCKVLHPR